MVMKIDITAIFRNWSSPYISRQDFCKITGNLFSFKTMRNLDSLGQGIPGKFLIGARKAVYPINNAIEWLEARVAKHNPKN